MIIRYIVYTQTLVKKSMHRAGTTKNRRPYLYLDRQYDAWEKDAAKQVAIQLTENGFPCVEYKCWAKITVYRRGHTECDLLGPWESIFDVLQRSGAVRNDKLIKSTDGSRVYHGVEAGTERFEVVLCAFMEEG